MSPTGKWVEVQIRSKRMDEIAEKGLAAHWKYKENDDKASGFDKWISQIREMIENHDNNAMDFVDYFKISTRDSSVEKIIGGQSNLDLLQRCIEAWKNHDCIKTIM